MSRQIKQLYINSSLTRDLQGYGAVEDVSALNKIIFQSPLGVNDGSIIEDLLINLDNSYALQQSLIRKLCNSSGMGIISKVLAKKLADSGIGYKHLSQVSHAYGERGLLAVLANPPTDRPSSSRGSSVSHQDSGSADTVVLNKILRQWL